MASSPFPRYSTLRITSAAVAAAAIGAFVLFRFEPVRYGHFYPLCVFHALTGLQCPGCGATRALYHLLHGDIRGAFRYNQLLFVMAPFFAVAARWPRLLTKPSVAWTLAVVVIGYGIVRNLPFWPYPI